jgi:hypothetical protein
MKTTDEEAILKKLGLDYHLLDSGCCGMAGSFGFERQHYHVSRAVGELVLLPAVREAARDTLVITNGFSCHEQIEQCTDRRPVHLAQVLRMALRQGAEGTAAGRPDDVMPPIRTPSRNGYRSAVGPALLVRGGAVLGGLLVWGLTRRRR